MKKNKQALIAPLVTSLVILALGACATDATQQEVAFEDWDEVQMYPPSIEAAISRLRSSNADVIYAVGSASAPILFVARDMAIANARGQLIENLEGFIVSGSFIAGATAGHQQVAATQLGQSITAVVARGRLPGDVHVYHEARTRDGMQWALVTVTRDTAVREIVQAVAEVVTEELELFTEVGLTLEDLIRGVNEEIDRQQELWEAGN